MLENQITKLLNEFSALAAIARAVTDSCDDDDVRRRTERAAIFQRRRCKNYERVLCMITVRKNKNEKRVFFLFFRGFTLFYFTKKTKQKKTLPLPSEIRRQNITRTIFFFIVILCVRVYDIITILRYAICTV